MVVTAVAVRREERMDLRLIAALPSSPSLLLGVAHVTVVVAVVAVARFMLVGVVNPLLLVARMAKASAIMFVFVAFIFLGGVVERGL